MPEPTPTVPSPDFSARLREALQKIDSTPTQSALPVPEKLNGIVFLHPRCMEAEDGNNVQLAERMVLILKHMFYMLGHNVKVALTYNNVTKVITRRKILAETQEIKHLVNMAFMAFFASNYELDKTIILLERKKIIPVDDGQHDGS